MAKEVVQTIFDFYMDSEARVVLSPAVLELYNIHGKIVYGKMVVVNGEKYFQISDERMKFYHVKLKMDDKNRIIIPKIVREKIGFEKKSKITGFEIEDDPNERMILLKPDTKPAIELATE